MNENIANKEPFLSKDKDARILVTGGFGFIGSRLIHRLNELGFHNIYIVDNLSEDNQRIANKLSFKRHIGISRFYELIEYANKEDVRRNLLDVGFHNCCNHIFHFGAISATSGYSFGDYNIWNYRFSKRLYEIYAHPLMELNSGEEHGSLINFVYTSSAATYGNTFDFSDDHKNLNNLMGNSNYALSKSLFDKYLYNNNKLDSKGFYNLIGIKPFNVFGDGEWYKNSMSSFVFQCFKGVWSGLSTIKIFSVDGEFPSRDFIHVDDVIDKTFGLIKEKSTGIFNVGNGVDLNWLDYTKIIQEKLQTLFDRKIAIISSDVDSMGSGYQTFTRSDNSKINKELNLENGTIEDLKIKIEGYLDNLYRDSDYYMVN